MSMPPTTDVPATPHHGDHPEDVVAEVLDNPRECTCEYVDIGVGHQKVAENPDCPRCTAWGMACAIVGALREAGMIATADCLTLAQHCKTYADGDVYLAATRVLHRAWKGAQ